MTAISNGAESDDTGAKEFSALVFFINLPIDFKCRDAYQSVCRATARDLQDFDTSKERWERDHVELTLTVVLVRYAWKFKKSFSCLIINFYT